MVPASSFRPGAVKNSSEFLTRAASAYPPLLNKALAHAMIRGVRRVAGLREKLREKKLQHSESQGMESVVQSVVVSQPLRGQQLTTVKQQEDKAALGGMRGPMAAVTRLRSGELGRRIRHAIEDYLHEHPTFMQAVLAAIGQPKGTFDQDCEGVLEIRRRIATILGATSIDAVDIGDVSSPLRADLLMAWASATQDPALRILHWLKEGAPAGIELDIPDIGVFPTKHDEVSCTVDDIYGSEQQQEGNYSSLEEDPDADAVMAEIMDPAKRWVKVFRTRQEVKEFVKGEPVVSQLGLVVKHKVDSKGTILSTKKRVILDCKRSRANELALARQRLLLPRPSHAVDDILRLMRVCRSLRRRLLRAGRIQAKKLDVDVELLISDFIDAYWAVPLHPSERKYQVARFGRLWLVLLRTGQGTKTSSLTWGLISALCGRLGQSLFEAHELLLQIYTDDPIAAVAGDAAQRGMRMSSLMCLWMALGLGVAFHKAVRGRDVVWIGARYELFDDHLTVSVTPELIEELIASIEAMLDANRVKVRDVRRLAGQGNHVAGLVFSWRPFLKDFLGGPQESKLAAW